MGLTRADNTQLRLGNARKQIIELRRPNRGKEITDRLLTVTVDPAALDLYAEVQPLDELVRPMRDKWNLVKKVEIPKWRKRQKLGEYGWGVMKGILKMDFLQFITQRHVARKKQEDLAALKQEILKFAAGQGYICGFTHVDRRFIAEGRDDKFPYDTALVLGMEMDRDLLNEIPHPGDNL